ncbi:AI-2E family transporter [Pararhodonellum marinum]|uniref:AI-2E family transporter n=1 Tax=Pararhodonellum marinum TaxID=2755358 RepID=UPI0018905A8A|nr:AI-2E family transporter [Pararhodonellum marinum]
MQKIILPRYITVLFILLLIIVIVFILIIGRGIMVPLFLSGYLAVILTPLSGWLERKKVPRILSIILSLLLGLATVAGLITLVILQVSSFTKDLDNVSDRLNNYLKDIDGFLSGYGLNTGIGNGIDKSQIIEMVESNSRTLGEFLLNTVGSMTSLILIPVFVFFFLLYRDHLTTFVAKLFHDQDTKIVKSEILQLRKLVQQYIVGMFKVMAILAVLNTGALYALGIKHALFFGLFAALLNIIPYLGPFLGAILPFIFAFLTKDSLFYPIAVVGIFTIIQLIESNFLTPKIVGNNVNLNAFVTFFGLLVGGAIWGVIGMILIIPTMAIMRRIFELSESTKPYAFLFGEEKST